MTAHKCHVTWMTSGDSDVIAFAVAIPFATPIVVTVVDFFLQYGAVSSFAARSVVRVW